MSNLGFRCEARVGHSVVTHIRHDATIDEAWDGFSDKMKALAEMTLPDPEDWEVIRVATVVNHKDA